MYPCNVCKLMPCRCINAFNPCFLLNNQKDSAANSRNAFGNNESQQHTSGSFNGAACIINAGSFSGAAENGFIPHPVILASPLAVALPNTYKGSLFGAPEMGILQHHNNMSLQSQPAPPWPRTNHRGMVRPKLDFESEEQRRQYQIDYRRHQQQIIDAEREQRKLPANRGTDLKQIDTLFQRYADKDSPDVIGPETIERLCMDLNIEITDVKLLMFAWKMQARRQGYFTLEEWHRGLLSLKADTIDKLKNSLPTLEQEVMRPENFSEFYIYSFQYCLTEDGQKYLDIESVCELLKLVLGKRNRAQVESLVEFLKNQEDCKAIILDQWKCFLNFFDMINYPSFDNYDLSYGWPLILDDYVEWAQRGGVETPTS